MNNIKEIFDKEIKKIKPDKEIFEKIKNICNEFCLDLRKKLKAKNIEAKVFVGGSLAKDTIIKKNKYDIDIFVRFNKKYDKKISEILGRILGKGAKKIHGSRDYYQLIIDGIIVEVVPVIEIKHPEEAKNVTDLSYFHVNYIVNKIKKNKKLSDEIRLAKTFAHAQNVYGAESYIHGFSGYALELLVSYYGSFLKFIKKIIEINENERTVIDDSRYYKNKEEVLMKLNESKLNSPIILIDPTFKERNALASLSKETLKKFKEKCREFLKNPKQDFFEKKPVEEKFSNQKNIKKISVKTNKQKGDIAGTKSRKFFDYFIYELKKEFEIKKAEFDYDENKNIANFYFIVENKKEEVKKGPPIISVENLTAFKKKHKNAFIKNGFSYSKITHKLNFEQWFKDFKKDNKGTINEMSIESIEQDFIK